MVWLKSLQSMGILAGVLAPALVSVASLPPQLQAEYRPDGRISLEFPPAADRGAPARTAGGGVRGENCMEQGATPLTALMPGNNVWTTVVANPTLFVYVPKTNAKEAEFSVLDAQGKDVYLEKVKLTGEAGVVKVTMPESAELKTGKDYTWSFSIVCNAQERSGDIYVRGVLQRTELSAGLKSELEKAAPLEQAQIYAKAQVWNETLALLAQLRNSSPQEWEQLLKSVGLEAIAQAPFIGVSAAELLPR
ncbi:DUF928 domain-containing protein [Kamptonema formosum]|uniref:DUF928 domain-containing protein n=1 Tax=Kamptonema formosum TaxID=331992 RepID=UPI000345EB78|nr:DUF928 domain-containing protein [Oscillatoria sp. PCC 10802]